MRDSARVNIVRTWRTCLCFHRGVSSFLFIRSRGTMSFAAAGCVFHENVYFSQVVSCWGQCVERLTREQSPTSGNFICEYNLYVIVILTNYLLSHDLRSSLFARVFIPNEEVLKGLLLRFQTEVLHWIDKFGLPLRLLGIISARICSRETRSEDIIRWPATVNSGCSVSRAVWLHKRRGTIDETTAGSTKGSG